MCELRAVVIKLARVGLRDGRTGCDGTSGPDRAGASFLCADAGSEADVPASGVSGLPAAVLLRLRRLWIISRVVRLRGGYGLLR